MATLDRVIVSPEEIAARVSAFVREMQAHLPLDWEALPASWRYPKRKWEGSDHELTEVVRQHVWTDGIEAPDSQRVHRLTMYLRGEDEDLSSQICVGGPDVDAEYPSQFVRGWILHRPTAGTVDSAVADALFASIVTAWEPLTCCMYTTGVIYAEEAQRGHWRDDWRVPSGYRVWLRDTAAEVHQVAEGVERRALAGGTLLSVPLEWPGTRAVEAMHKTRELNGLDKLPRPEIAMRPPPPKSPHKAHVGDSMALGKEVNVYAILDRVKSPPEEIASRISAFVDKMDARVPRGWDAFPLRWTPGDSPTRRRWEGREDELTAFVRENVYNAALGAPLPEYGYGIKLLSHTQTATFGSHILVGGSDIGNSRPLQTIQGWIHHRDDSDSVDPANADSLVESIVEAWEPLVCHLNTIGTAEAEETQSGSIRGSWHISTGYRIWLRNGDFRVDEVAEGVERREFAGGTLLSVPFEWPAEDVARAMLKTLKMNGLGEIPHPVL